MPWTEKQVKLFYAAADNPALAKRIGITPSKAAEMAKEGIKKEKPESMMAKALRGKK